MPMLHRRAALMLAAALTTLPALAANAFPERGQTIRLVVPFAAGGGVDQAARLLGTQLQKQLGVTVIVDNKAGANGTIGGKAVQMAPADGLTLLFSAATHALAKQVLASPPYDPQTDFAPVARIGEAPLLLVLAPGKPQTRLADLVGAIKQQPDRWTVGIPAAGAPSHLATLLMARQAQLKLTFVPYKGTQPALMDVAGGHTDLLFDSVISLQQMAKSGKVRAIATSGNQRSSLLPDVPTAQESGLAGFRYASWYGVWAPRDTPVDRVSALNTAINSAVRELTRNGALAALGIEPVVETPEQFRREIANEVAEGSELLKSAGFRPD